MIQSIREALSWPFIIVACAFLWMATFVGWGFTEANEALNSVLEGSNWDGPN